MIENKKVASLFMVIVLTISLLGILIYMFFYTNISLTGDTVTELYSYLGNDKITNCADDLFYLSSGASYSTMDSESLLCNAYLYVEDSGVEVEIEEGDEEGICSIDTLLLATDYESDICTALQYNIETLSDAYYTIYGETLTSYDSFSLSNGTVCSFNEDDGYYYCYSSAEEITISLSSDITYRLLKSAVDVYDGTIVIRDYFLNISDSTCYADIANTNKNYDCTSYIEEFSDLQIDNDFMKSYSGLYEHTFEQDENGDYHWISTEKIS